MKKGLLSALLILTLLLSFSSAAAAQNIPINEITKITVQGNDYVGDFEILNAVQTEVGDQTDQEALRADMQSVFDLGYFSDVNIVFENFEGGLNVIFEVVENPVLEAIELSGYEGLYTAASIKNELDLQTGTVLNVKKMNQNLKSFQEKMQDDGYILARYKNVNISDEGVLTVEISPGRLDTVEISGNTKTDNDVILREMPIEAGEIININKIQRGYQNLYRLEYFENINPELERVDSENNLAKLVINLDEANTGRLNFGGGYSSTDGWIGFVEASEKNLFGNGQNIGAKWQFGDTTTYSLNFYEPYLMDTNYSFGFSVYDRETDRTTSYSGSDESLDYIRKSKGGSLSLGHPLPKDWSTSLRYRIEDTEEVWDETNPDYSDVIEGEKFTDTELRSLTLSFNRDTSNNRFHPTSGSINNFSVEYAGGFMGGNMDFTKFNWDSRRYFPGFSDHAVAARMKLGLSDPRTPLGGEEYDLGGSDSLRGYERSDFDSADRANNNLLLLNLEYRIPFNESFTGVLFTDAGNVWEDRDSISLDDLKYGYGLGMRMNTPVGQLRLDYGWDEDQDGQLHFSIGNTF
ncbi:Beta-barrel assembly machine subunit BamA [Halanaerobium saccharolyticum]|uniref:Beta-barrel assembly machine subunit BamA n=1 Tax=Halanaerobium saccharolyticum TaxID=43595 RepID=A0A4R7Z917_9FIRM|nr:BamA/TamA family outer membrane protein [Halanaerobium saccharolyticum]RAK09804.1 Beta-barrel assembly machine subunit BamA [Halanaerobium saccharolyticum]TDW07366.1 Beta-barrel assembly machine subunit BamA [Halanaerobium saccharolyticum]TDX61245.1 Beta-barrel assembly machine subunit BamA [Halanaerobium saccharolyticum]